MKDQSVYSYWLAAFRVLTKPHGSQVKIAQLTGVTPKYINDIIGERRGASLALQGRIASAFGLTYEKMLFIGRSDTETQTQHILSLLNNAKRLIEIRESSSFRKKTIPQHIVITTDDCAEYIGCLLDIGIPRSADETSRIYQACLGLECDISYIDGSKKYSTNGKELNLPESLEFVQNQGGDILSELEKYISATGITPQSSLILTNYDDEIHAQITLEKNKMQLPEEICGSTQNIYLPETIALAEAIDRLFRKNSQFKRSELTMLTLSFLKQHGLSEDSQ